MKKEKKKLTQEEKDERFYYRAHAAFAGIVRFFLRAHITGKENIPMTGGYLVCVNHIGNADAVALAAVSPRRLRFLAKMELFRVPILGSFIRRIGAYPLDRSGSDVSAIRRSIELIESGQPVTVFPQGHRRPGKYPMDTPIRAGVGMIAHRAQCPVLPVCIRTKKMRHALFRRVDVIVGELIPYEKLPLSEGGRDAYAAATDVIMRRICLLGGFPTEPSGEEAGK